MIKIGTLDDVSRDDELLDTVVKLLKDAGVITYAPRDGQYAEAYGAVVNVTLADGRTATILISVD